MSNPFTRLFGFGRSSGQPGQDSIIALDFGSSSAKVIQLRRDHGRIVLETYGEISTGPYVGMSIGQSVNLGVDKMAEVVTDLLRESSVTAKMGAMAIPLRSSLLVVLEIPNLSKTDLAQAVPNEARRFIPVPISEVALDWWIIPEREDISPAFQSQDPAGKKSEEVLIAAIHRDTTTLYQDLAKRLGLAINAYEIETFSLIRAAMTNDLSATAIVDMGAGTTKVAIVDYGVVRVSHTINKGSQDISLAISKSLDVSFEKAEEIKRKVGLVESVAEGDVQEVISPIVEYIFDEVKRVIINYQKKHTVAVEKVVMVGGGSQLRGVLELAKKSLEMQVTIGSPFDKMETPAFLENVLKEAGPSFAVSIGLALRLLEEND